MAKVEDLERLSQLHADGRLTDEEFAAAKAKLLSGGPPVVWLGLGVLVVVVAAVAAIVLSRPLLAKPQPAQAVTPGPTLAEQPVVPQPAASSDVAATSSSKIGRLINVDQIGGKLSKFEAVAGKPTEALDGLRSYKVDGCEITVEYTDQTIDAITLELSKTCHPTDVLGGIEDWTFAGLEKKFGAGGYGASCLKLCGNAYDPDIFLLIPAKVSKSVDMELSAVLVTDPIIEASNRWEAVMTKAEGEDYVFDNKFACGKYDDLAHSLFGKFQITSLRIGPDGRHCD